MPDSFFSLPPYTLHEVGNIETLSDSLQWGLVNLNVPDVWKETMGEGIRVMTLDTGTTKHPDLLPNLNLNLAKSFIPNEDVFDTGTFHATHVQGIVASASNGYGVIGVAPKATIIPVKVLSKSGMSSGDSVLKGLQYALQVNPDIVNMSLGTYSPMSKEKELIKQLVDNGTVVVCAAGNYAEKGVMFPAAYDECIAVGAYMSSVTRDRASFSAIGPELDFMAPGQEILSTFGEDKYAVMSGSSMAAPFISGVIALLLSNYNKENKKITVAGIKELLKKHCVDVPSGGFNNEKGFGIVDPKSLIFAQEVVETPVVKKSFWQKLLFWRK